MSYLFQRPGGGGGGGGGSSLLSVTDLHGTSTLDEEAGTVEVPANGIVQLGDTLTNPAEIWTRIQYAVGANGYVGVGFREDTGDPSALDGVGARIEHDGSTQCASFSGTLASPTISGNGNAAHKSGGWGQEWVDLSIDILNTISNGTLDWTAYAGDTEAGVRPKNLGNALNVLQDWTRDGPGWSADLIVINLTGQPILIDLRKTATRSFDGAA